MENTQGINKLEVIMLTGRGGARKKKMCGSALMFYAAVNEGNKTSVMANWRRVCNKTQQRFQYSTQELEIYMPFVSTDHLQRGTQIMQLGYHE